MGLCQPGASFSTRHHYHRPNGILPRLRDFLAQLYKHPVMSVISEDAELILWKRAAPAFVECCRDWEHIPSCEYATDSTSVVLSIQFGEGFVCSCGLGRLPEDYKPHVPLWDSVARYCVRDAIGLCFSVPFVDIGVDLGSVAMNGTVGHVAGQK